MSLKDLLKEFCAGVETGDGARLANTFNEDGVYDDIFYGTFTGRPAIAAMLEEQFWRDGEAFKWDMHDVVDNGETGFAHWFFSYVGKAEHIKGKRIYMEGVGLFRLRDGLLTRYEDFARSAELFDQLNLPPQKQAKIVRKMRDASINNPRFDAHRALEG